jgi:hypothetical protein
MATELRKIVAKYPGICSGCGKQFKAGDQILYAREGGVGMAYHPTCAGAATAPAPFCVAWRILGRSDVPKPGYVFFSERDNKVLVVVRSASYYFRDDESDGENAGWVAFAYCREATQEEAAPVLAEREKAAKQKAAQAEIEELHRLIRERGDIPRDRKYRLSGEVLADTTTIYGTGSYFVIEPDWIWSVMRHGMDGDDWSQNNVDDGGAGSIGWRIPHDDTVASRIRTAASLLR